MSMYGPDRDGRPQGGGHPTRWWIALGVGLTIIAIFIVVLVLLVTGVLALGSAAPRPYGGLWGGFFLLFLLVWVSFFVVRILLWSGRGQGHYGRGGPYRDPAVMAARQRYARGEITREQFDQIMTDLGRRGRGPGGPLSGA
jgi:uncharacterized membrane protein